uniref:Sulfotransferase n=1 Tax=Chrysotila carterae TaxID=13221 RepID=A0A7S4FBN5_CHRCT
MIAARMTPRFVAKLSFAACCSLLLKFVNAGCFGDCGQYKYQSVPTVKPANGWCSRDRRIALAQLNLTSAFIAKARPIIMLKLPRTGSEWITSLLSNHPAIGSCYHELLHVPFNSLGGMDQQRSMWLSTSGPAYNVMDAALKCNRIEDAVVEWEQEMRGREELLRSAPREDRCAEDDEALRAIAERERPDQCEVFCASPCFNINPYKIFSAGAFCTDWLEQKSDENQLFASKEVIAPFKAFVMRVQARIILLIRDNTFASALSEYKAAWASQHKPCGKLNYFLKSPEVCFLVKKMPLLPEADLCMP